MATTHPFGTDDDQPSLIRWPEERPAYTSLAAAVQGERARWNGVGMAASVICGEEEREMLRVWSRVAARQKG